VTACVDSDVLIDYFYCIPAAAEELSRYGGLAPYRIMIARPADTSTRPHYC
jgi:hypothetical protein